MDQEQGEHAEALKPSHCKGEGRNQAWTCCSAVQVYLPRREHRVLAERLDALNLTRSKAKSRASNEYDIGFHGFGF